MAEPTDAELERVARMLADHALFVQYGHRGSDEEWARAVKGWREQPELWGDIGLAFKRAPEVIAELRQMDRERGRKSVPREATEKMDGAGTAAQWSELEQEWVAVQARFIWRLMWDAAEPPAAEAVTIPIPEGQRVCVLADPAEEAQAPPAIGLFREGQYAVVKIETRGRWVELIRAHVDGQFSHIIEPLGIADAIERGEHLP